jgi:(p)ppGpp synthase/HD superfamily hydrolase
MPYSRISILSEEYLQKILSGQTKNFILDLDTNTPCIAHPTSLLEAQKFTRLETLVKKILQVAKLHFSKRQQKKIIEALHYSAVSHKGIYREDKITPYFLHPLEVACILIDFGIYDFKITVAAILHDVVEDTDASLKEIQTCFGAGVRNIVDLMTKHPNFIRKWRYWTLMKEEPDMNCRWRVIVLKFADRIHNLMTLGVMPEEKKLKKIKETLYEFPTLHNTLARTLHKLYEKGTLKHKKNRRLAFILNNRLHHELSRYE